MVRVTVGDKTGCIQDTTKAKYLYFRQHNYEKCKQMMEVIYLVN
ncbi:MAG: hypothetical protein WCK67_10625 [bacterium]